MSVGGTHLYIDPGPGALVRCLHSKPKLDPSELDGIVLTHRHLDHSGDVNVMIEAMTEGGFKRRGTLFAPSDALGEDPVVLKYIREYVKTIEVLQENGHYRIGDISFSTADKHRHRVETYGLNFDTSPRTISFITDTRFFPELLDLYKGEILVIHVARLKAKGGEPADHLCIDDVKAIVRKVKPRLTVLTHFGMTMIKAKPWEVAATLERELKTRVMAAHDGLTLNLKEV